jgi:AcrR family transcriptional regulator
VARRGALKANLLVAAQRAMAEHGTSVRLNQIASEAGVTAGAVLYHYPNMQELLFEANQSGMARFHDQRLEALVGISDPAARLIQTIRTGVPEGPEDPDVRLLCALGGEAARNNLYALLLTSLFDRQVSMYQGILEMGVSAGAFALRQDSVTIARNLVALEDAYGYRMMAKHPTLGYDSAVELIVEYARLATGHPLPLETS